MAIESQGIRYGIANSLTGDFVPNEIKTHTTTFNNINQYNLIQDRNKLEVVAILFDTKNNRIENVAKCHITVPEQEFTMNFDVCDWATLYTDRPYIVPQGVATYQINAQGDVEMVTDGTGANVSIAANTPMLLKGQKATPTPLSTPTPATRLSTRHYVALFKTSTPLPATPLLLTTMCITTNWYTMTAAPKQAFIGLKKWCGL